MIRCFGLRIILCPCWALETINKGTLVHLSTLIVVHRGLPRAGPGTEPHWRNHGADSGHKEQWTDSRVTVELDWSDTER